MFGNSEENSVLELFLKIHVHAWMFVKLRDKIAHGMSNFQHQPTQLDIALTCLCWQLLGSVCERWVNTRWLDWGGSGAADWS